VTTLKYTAATMPSATPVHVPGHAQSHILIIWQPTVSLSSCLMSMHAQPSNAIKHTLSNYCMGLTAD
jgi:hypothetical protein